MDLGNVVQRFRALTRAAPRVSFFDLVIELPDLRCSPRDFNRDI